MSSRQQQQLLPPHPPHPYSGKLKNVVSPADRAILEEHYTFVPPSETKEGGASSSTTRATTWQERMVQRYHDGLYKEYAIADLSSSKKSGQIGLRWRTQQEVLNGRGETTCGNKHCPHTAHPRQDAITTTSSVVTGKDDHDDSSTRGKKLSTIEVPFSYSENGIAKKELVKLRLCQSCRPIFFDATTTRKSKDTKRIEHHTRRRRRRRKSTSDDDDDDDELVRTEKKKSKKRRIANNNNNNNNDVDSGSIASSISVEGNQQLLQNVTQPTSKPHVKKQREEPDHSSDSDSTTCDREVTMERRRKGDSRRRRKGRRKECDDDSSSSSSSSSTTSSEESSSHKRKRKRKRKKHKKRKTHKH